MPVSDVVLTNVRISAAKGLQIFNAKQIEFKNSALDIAKGPAIISGNAQVAGLDAQASGK